MSESKFILLAEDNPDDELLTLRAFKKNKISNKVIVARDGTEVLNWLFRKHLRPHLILLDIKLPKLSGLEVLAKIRNHQETSLIPVILLTSSVEESDILEGYRLRTNSYICKPTDYKIFEAMAQELHKYWLMSNIAPPSLKLSGKQG